MDSDSGDLILKMVLNGTAIDGAGQSVMTAPGKQPSPLVKGFVWGKMIEIDAFSLRCGTSGLEPGAPPPPPLHDSTFATKQKDPDDKTESLAPGGQGDQIPAGHPADHLHAVRRYVVESADPKLHGLHQLRQRVDHQAQAGGHGGCR
jgi:hypothetical protein